MKLILFVVLLLAYVQCQNSTVAPILVIHGIGSSCSISTTEALGDHYQTYTHCFDIGSHYAPFVSIFTSIMEQGKYLCEFIHEDEQLKHGNFSIAAFSQGAILTKYLLEYCDFEDPIRTVTTFGGPHMGVSEVPRFPKSTWIGYILAWLANRFFYWDFTLAQRFVSPADYWYDPANHDGFLKHSKFLAEANNEINFDQARKDKWTGLLYARFVKWEEDTVIIPRESSWWGMDTPDYTTVSRYETDVYKKDLVGIKTLEESGKADFLSLPGDHMQYSHEQLFKMTDDVVTR